jgi:hypothetical protein
MAGAGYKLFATGDVLTAAQVNTYLMQQTVMVFASSAARTTALSGVLAEGMVSYLQDTNTLEVYDGSAWVGATGDITGLTAGTGISISSATGPVPTVAIDTATTVDKTTAQTLTNKTLTSPVLTTPSISNIEAKGDILVGTADNTLGVITAGANGETIVADSSTSTGLRYQSNFSAGKNKVINGAFDIWQRGTSFTLGVGDVFTADRYRIGVNGSSLGTNTVSQQTFTPGSAPVAGYEGQYFLRVANTSAGSGMTYFASDNCWIEDVRNFAGQTVTLSFWAKSNASRTMAMDFYQIFGTGGSSPVQTSITSANLTTSWTRFSVTFAVPSVSGKTIGAGSCSFIRMYHPQNATFQFDIWGLQMEASNTATAFQTATGTLQGELDACKRYCQNINYSLSGKNNYNLVGTGMAVGATESRVNLSFPAPMRVAPTSVTFTSGGFAMDNYTSAPTVTNVTINQSGTDQMLINVIASAGVLAFKDTVIVYALNNSNANLIFSAEL